MRRSLKTYIRDHVENAHVHMYKMCFYLKQMMVQWIFRVCALFMCNHFVMPVNKWQGKKKYRSHTERLGFKHPTHKCIHKCYARIYSVCHKHTYIHTHVNMQANARTHTLTNKETWDHARKNGMWISHSRQNDSIRNVVKRRNEETGENEREKLMWLGLTMLRYMISWSL